MGLALYIAAPLNESRRARTVGGHLAGFGHEIVSRWHHIVSEGAIDPMDDASRARICAANDRALERADVVIALTDRGVGRSTYVEIGLALAMGRTVLWLHGEDGAGRCSHDAHPLVLRVTTEDQIVAALRGLQPPEAPR